MRTEARTEIRIDTPVGPVRGTRSDGVVHAGGVPYARAERWGAPEPITWAEPLDATQPGAVPPQVVGGLDLVPGMTPSQQSEHCLSTEIWTPALDGRLPVIVWVPGGSYRIGGASLPTYDGSRLASESAVVVGCNYRLGALGWLAADGVPTNLGLRDLAAAVPWVREIAPAFGGDPDRIVLMGESAGAGALAHLLATGDVHAAGAILQSGAPAGTLEGSLAEWVAGQFFDAAGVDGVDALRDVPVDAVLDAQEQAVVASLGKVGMMPFHPFLDGDLLAARAFCSPLAPVSLVVSTTANEMELFRDQVPTLPEDIALGFLTSKAAALGITDEASVRAGLQACDGDLVDALADLELHVPNELMARAHRARGQRVWRARFNWEAPNLGACHALDLPFNFGTLDVAGWRDFAGADDPRADELSARMRAAWRSFAATGEPSDGVIGPWPEDQLVGLGTDATVGPDAVERRLDAWLGRRVGMSALEGRVAIVTGASRGIGKGCALELGAAGATVYVTGRSLTESDHPLPGTVGATASEIAGLGGTCIAVACDHRDDEAVAELFARVAAEHGQLDILVNNAFIVTNELTSGLPFWEVPLSNWDDMIDVGTRSAYVASVFAARSMVSARSGLIVNISGSGAQEYAWSVAYGVGKCALDRLTADTALELAAHSVSVVSLWPGFVRTERIDVAVGHGLLPDTLDVDSAESPRFTGRGVVALATDPDASRWSGRAVTVRDLAESYGFRDLDDRLPPGPMRHEPPSR